MNLPLNRLSHSFAAAPQLQPTDMQTLATLGFKTVINNRPDGEGGPAQPTSTDIEKAARAAGLIYHHLPVVSGSITAAQAQAMAGLLRQAESQDENPVLAFCRSGARSAHLWQLAHLAQNE